MILFGNPLNGSVRIVRCGALIKGVKLDHVLVMRGGTDPVFRAVSPAGIVPALRDEHLIMTGAYAIVEHLDRLQDKPALIPVQIERRVETHSLCQVANGPLAQVSSTVFQNRIFIPRFMGKAGNLRVADRVLRATTVFDTLEKLLANQTYRGVDIPDMADIAIFSHVLNLMICDFRLDKRKYPRLTGLVEHMFLIPDLEELANQDARMVGLPKFTY